MIKIDFRYGNARAIEWKGDVTPDTENDYLWSAQVPACDWWYGEESEPAWATQWGYLKEPEGVQSSVVEHLFGAV